MERNTYNDYVFECAPKSRDGFSMNNLAFCFYEQILISYFYTWQFQIYSKETKKFQYKRHGSMCMFTFTICNMLELCYKLIFITIGNIRAIGQEVMSLIYVSSTSHLKCLKSHMLGLTALVQLMSFY